MILRLLTRVLMVIKISLKGQNCILEFSAPKIIQNEKM